MLIAAILLVATPIETPNSGWSRAPITQELHNAKKKRKASSSGGGARKFKSCKEALRAGYSHMRRGQPGYSPNLDRDGDGVACDKVK
jgi:Excalibur calcium-binding domain